MDRPIPHVDQVDILSDDSFSDTDDAGPVSEKHKNNMIIDRPAEEVISKDLVIRKAQMYQEYMKEIRIPIHRGSVIPFTSWTGLAKSIKLLYNQPLHYLTNILVKQWDKMRIGGENEFAPLDSIIHPVKAEATIWLMEEVHRLTTSHHHLAKLWLSDPVPHMHIDSIFPKLEDQRSKSSSSSSSSNEDQHEISRKHRKRVQKVVNILPPILAALSQPRRRRRYFERGRERSHQQIWKDYFDENSTYPDDIFRRRNRMRKGLFLRILKDIETKDKYFIQSKDCTGRMGLSSIQKMIVAIRILAYGASTDQCDEYIKIGESTAIKSMKLFCKAIISLYEDEYMRSPNEQDITRLLQEGKDRGFPGMLGSIDCMHWEWKNCPTAWHGTHKGHHNKPTLILEAVASKDLWIWHVFFGMTGSHNDLNVVDHSPVFDTFIYGEMPDVNFEVNGRPYTLGYYLSDGIYPRWTTLMQTIAHPTTEKERLFAKKQEAVRKDIERAFGVLQLRWGITKGPVRYWKKNDLCIIMKACIILHNMIIEDERDVDVEEWRPPTEDITSLPEYIENPTVRIANISARLRRVRNKQTNAMLRLDLMEHLWVKYGNEVI